MHVERLCLSDHYDVFCNRKSQSNISKNIHPIITYRSFRNFEENRFLNDLYSVPWEIIEQFDNLDDIVSSWNALLLEVLDMHAPIRHNRAKKKYQPDWLTPEIMDLMKERNKCKINGNMDDYRYLRNKVSKQIEMAKKNTYQSKIEEGRSDPKTIWKIFKELGANLRENSCESNINIKLGEQLITNELDLSELFNHYFVTVASNLKDSMTLSDNELLINFIQSKVPNTTEFNIPLTDLSFIRTFLSNLNVNKSTGLDNICPIILKLSANVLAPSLLYIVNKNLMTGEFPCSWKEAKVKPLFKSGTKDDKNNYQPISILPTVSKLIEKWIENTFPEYLNEYDLLYQSQSGSRSNQSTKSATVRMIDSWLKAVNYGKLTGCMMVDFRKAFDLVDHKILFAACAEFASYLVPTERHGFKYG